MAIFISSDYIVIQTIKQFIKNKLIRKLYLDRLEHEDGVESNSSNTYIQSSWFLLRGTVEGGTNKFSAFSRLSLNEGSQWG